jgi:hypothetical protein
LESVDALVVYHLVRPIGHLKEEIDASLAVEKDRTTIIASLHFDRPYQERIRDQISRGEKLKRGLKHLQAAIPF